MPDIKRLFTKLFMDQDIKQKIEFFSQVTILNGLGNFDIGKLVTDMNCRAYDAQEVIYGEQELGKALFIIMSGEVAITRKSGLLKEEKVIARLKSGDFFGEMALLEAIPRAATAKALTSCKICIIYKASFDSMIAKDPKIGIVVFKNIAVILASRLLGKSGGG
ncbi:MAG: cyclic nucleotide-binding domain-containing protein [bacterium]|nr:cyclic nucleotide-binding domain-containing protein [bacterium]MDD5354461.1 cyclic nucleotide-binding domain-containing protein [bacterium]MDD5756352.1 cyclic nucleotide-binding domain-containing protein [bacterium]